MSILAYSQIYSEIKYLIKSWGKAKGKLYFWIESIEKIVSDHGRRKHEPCCMILTGKDNPEEFLW